MLFKILTHKAVYKICNSDKSLLPHIVETEDSTQRKCVEEKCMENIQFTDTSTCSYIYVYTYEGYFRPLQEY